MILLGLGSNIGDREGFLRQAIALLAAETSINIKKTSAIYETEPFGFKEQAAFLNMAVAIETKLTAQELLRVCQRVELELNRKREIHWGPRTIDIDILLYNDMCINEADLIIPHLYLAKRRFVLVPLAEIAPAEKAGGRTIDELLQTCEDTGEVNFYANFS